jgi:beta-alanine--pyruvate transaminase
MGHAELTIQDQTATKQISLDEYWMPFTPNREFKADPKMIVRAEGMYFWNDRGGKIIDASSGLFCVNAGHGRREIADAVGKQLRELDFCAPFTRGHPKQFELATRVAELTPGDLNRIFFCNSGSESVDTAMKLALAYHQARGQGGRNVFVSRERAYHGVNFGGVALSGLVNNRRKFGAGLPGIAHMRHTHLKENFFTKGEGAHGVDLAEDLTRFVNLYGAENIAACFVEPIGGSAGCLVPPKGYLKRLREICDAHGILLVFDEVICGFGRTGQTFAAQSFGVTPDILTMAKGITNGAQPMGAVAISERIHDTIMAAAPEGAIEFFHGYTYSGHPGPCAAGLATLDIYKNDGLFARGRELSPYFIDAVFSLRDLPVVADIRGYGMFAAIDVHADGAPGRRGHILQKKLFDNGLHLKATGDCAILAPPLIAEKKHVDEIADILKKTLATL